MKQLSMVTLSLLLGAMLAAACATTEKFEEDLEYWVGEPEERLISWWGPPHRVYEVNDDTKILTWSASRTATMPITTPQTTYGSGSIYSGSNYGSYSSSSTTYSTSYYNMQMSCTVDMTITDGRVSTWRWSGNDCRK